MYVYTDRCLFFLCFLQYDVISANGFVHQRVSYLCSWYDTSQKKKRFGFVLNSSYSVLGLFQSITVMPISGALLPGNSLEMSHS